MKHSKMDGILINVLTRTSNRPLGFQKCHRSIQEQTYKNIRHIVSYDDCADLWYLKDLEISLVDVSKIKNTDTPKVSVIENRVYAPYNLYCNALLEVVDDGWILFLDDDDNLYQSKVIEELVARIEEIQN